MSFLVAEKLAISVLLDSDFYDKNVEATKQRLKVVEMDEQTAVPIISQHPKSQVEALLPEDQRLQPRKPLASTNVKAAGEVKLPSPSQNCVEMKT